LDLKRDEVIGGWKNLHNKELHNLYCSPSIIRMLKLSKLRLVGHMARMGEKRNTYKIKVTSKSRYDQQSVGQ
jgi:hypothetical protein